MNPSVLVKELVIEVFAFWHVSKLHLVVLVKALLTDVGWRFGMSRDGHFFGSGGRTAD